MYLPRLPCKGSCQRQLTEGFSQRGFLTASHWYPLVSKADIPASSQAAYPSFPPKGEKLRSLPFARRKSPWGTPPFPTEPIAQPSAALLRYGCGIPLAGTSLGFGGDPQLGNKWGAQSLPCKGRWRKAPEGFFRGAVAARRRSVQKIHLPPVDIPVENGYNEDVKERCRQTAGSPHGLRSNRTD